MPNPTDDVEAKRTYANVSATYEVQVPEHDDDQQRHLARNAVKKAFYDEFGFMPGLRSTVTVERRQRAAEPPYDTRFDGTVVAQEKQI